MSIAARLRAYIFSLLFASSAYADCTSPSAVLGQLTWVVDKVMWCDGTDWKDASVATGGSCSGTPTGTMTYTSSEVHYCDGTNWINTKGPVLGTCSGTPAGTIQYDSGSSKMRFCDGTDWYTIGSGAVSCPASGSFAGEACWYLGATGQSCDATCNASGLLYHTDTRSFAGSSGTNADCDTVMDALGVGGTAASNLSFSAIGCAFNGTARRRGTSSTTSTATNGSYQRACACYLPDYVPDAMDWANFNDVSSIQTVTGLGDNINIEISAANNAGTPEISYSLNGGTWTLFAAGTPVTLNNIGNGTTLQFRVVGTVSNAVTITVTNLSDSNTVLDTTVGTVTVAADVTPDAIDWADFTGISETIGLSGFNYTISLQLSAAYGTGSPTINYSLDGGAWVAITPGSPVTLNGIIPGRTLRFGVSGTNGHTATITVRNVTDGNVILDTTVGTVGCAGFAHGGYCYYLGANVLEGCDTICAGIGKVCDDAGTQAGAVSTACTPIMTGLGIPVGTTSAGSYSYACAVNSSNNLRADDTPTNVTCDAWNFSYRRSCACLEPDATPSPINWANFNDTSASQTFYGINLPINLQLSAVHTSGSPDYWYRKNGGAWTPFSTVAPGTVSVAAGDSIEFRVLGNSGDSGTITVTNLSDSNTVLDTVTGTVTLTSDGTPDAVDWADFLNLSGNVTFTGFTRAIVLEVSVVHNSGAPVYSYSTNGVTWTDFSPGSPATLSTVVSGSSLKFRVRGVLGEAGTITVRNTSDGNTVLDTMVGSTDCNGDAAFGGCFRFGALGESCDTVCGALGGGQACDLINTQEGSESSECQYMLEEIYGLSLSLFISSGYQYACASNGTDSMLHNSIGDIAATTCDASWPAVRRVCACHIPDPSVDAIDWPDFNDISISQAITGMNLPITLQLSVVHGSGTPDYWYRKNGGAWSFFSPSSPATVTVRPNDTIEFRVLGVIGNSGTITVRNQSDGNAILDTTTGTASVNADATPDAIDWANFNNASSVQTLDGFERALTLQLSAVNGTGAPTLGYSLNGGAWTNFTSGSPATVTGVTSGTTLQFRITGTNTHSATITITNITDSNVILDTTVATRVACAGVSYGGYCFHWGATTYLDCNQVCHQAGGTCNLTGTQAYAANEAGCQALAQAFGGSASSSSSSNTFSYTCATNSSGSQFHWNSVSSAGITCEASAWARRICACN